VELLLQIRHKPNVQVPDIAMIGAYGGISPIIGRLIECFYGKILRDR